MLGISSRSSAAVNVMVLTVQKAATGLIRDFGELEKLQVSAKDFGNFVTTADQRSERLLIDELSKARPEYDILSEERGEVPARQPRSKFDQNGGYKWIIDPLDGTMNFLHGIPHFAVSVALSHHDEVIAGVVFNPITNELYWGERGAGAFLNNRRIRVSGRRAMASAIVATGSTFGFRGRDDGHARLNAISKRIGAIRHFGATSLDLAFVASGKMDAFFDARTNAWDTAAGEILVKEAGGSVSPYGDGIVASNLSMHDELKGILE
ncbi:MAG: inositol monophosphatase [Holosporales bacterium]|jgi:myo-inositol-1(or 4)-monophosphatase|nr:inositol monophosphatase [Holosporales bacterium]